MSTQQEFDSLFRSVWIGEAPAEALADWIMSRLEDGEWLPEQHKWMIKCAHHHFEAYPDKYYTALLQVMRTQDAADGPYQCRFRVDRLEMADEEQFTAADFCDRFPLWIAEEIDFLYYVLSK